jgi:hypothetical protein
MPWKYWFHNCTKSNGARIGRTTEICPECGERGQYDGWHYSVVEFMGAYSRRTKLKPYGPHRALADKLLDPRMPACSICHGRGVLDVNNGERYEMCPNCKGSLALFDGTEEEFEALRQKVLDEFPDAAAGTPSTPSTTQTTNTSGGFTGGGFFRPFPADRTLQAYKDWSNNMFTAMRPTSEDKKPMTEEEWEKNWKEFWSKMDSASNSAKNDKQRIVRAPKPNG